MPTTTKSHVVDSLLDSDQNRQIFYNQNTMKDVIVDDEQTETIEGHLNYYATCETDAAEAAKTITVVGGTHDVMKAGARFDVTFTNGNTAESATLSVNSGTAYTLTGITATSINAGQTVSFIFTGSDFVVGGSSSSGTEVVNEDVASGTKYVAYVDGESSNAEIKYDSDVQVTSDGLVAPVGSSTVAFTDATAEANTDYRTSNALTTGDTTGTIAQKIKKIFSGMGSMAFKSAVGTTELDSSLSTTISNVLLKSDLYSGLDYSTSGSKALDASAGLTLQNSITNLNSLVSSFGAFKTLSTTVSGDWDDKTTAGWYMGQGLDNAPTSSSSQWFHVLVIRHNDLYIVQVAYAFTSSSCPVYIRTMTGGIWNSWRNFNPGTATAAQVLSGYTFSSTAGSNLSGTMTNRGSVTATLYPGGSYTIPSGYHNGSGSVIATGGSIIELSGDLPEEDLGGDHFCLSTDMDTGLTNLWTHMTNEKTSSINLRCTDSEYGSITFYHPNGLQIAQLCVVANNLYGYSPKGYIFSTSDDNSTFTTCASYTVTSGNSTCYAFYVGSPFAKYAKIQVLQHSSSYSNLIYFRPTLISAS